MLLHRSSIAYISGIHEPRWEQQYGGIVLAVEPSSLAFQGIDIKTQRGSFMVRGIGLDKSAFFVIGLQCPDALSHPEAGGTSIRCGLWKFVGLEVHVIADDGFQLPWTVEYTLLDRLQFKHAHAITFHFTNGTRLYPSLPFQQEITLRPILLSTDTSMLRLKKAQNFAGTMAELQFIVTDLENFIPYNFTIIQIYSRWPPNTEVVTHVEVRFPYQVVPSPFKGPSLVKTYYGLAASEMANNVSNIQVQSFWHVQSISNCKQIFTLNFANWPNSPNA